jgi:hypothetical protein
MQNTYKTVGELVVEEVEIAFNCSKLQAFICIAVSAFVSSGLLVWAVKSFI